ncbi:MAG TPA: SAM-dependent methyltransferase [Caldimonas sp.]|nr:SAM-dependent methyltransferase [Caldimonas sp.]
MAEAVASHALGTLVLSKNRHAGESLKSVRARLVGLRGRPTLSIVYRHETREDTRNFEPDAGLAAIGALLDPQGETSFAHAVAQTPSGQWQLLTGRRGRQTLRRIGVAGAVATKQPGEGGSGIALPAHDRPKVRALPLDLPFLAELGIADEGHRLVPSMARKWRQIDKFLEVLDDALDAAHFEGGAPLRVVDFGSGKGYLTFAVHEHLRRRFGVAPEVTGVELRGELVELCNGAATRCAMEGLVFVEGDLRSVEPPAVDVMIALHACDTATDHAIDLGMRAGARILVCSPCCHKELRPQMRRPAPLGALFRHGIHVAQEAEMVTDSLRALVLEACGFDAKVFEFVSLEHTRKNKMILATRRGEPSPDEGAALAEIEGLKSFYGIREQCLERLVRERVGEPFRSRGRS